MSVDANALFQPSELGDLTLPNRLVMAPLTRNRAAEGDVARDITATYYAQRAVSTWRVPSCESAVCA